MKPRHIQMATLTLSLMVCSAVPSPAEPIVVSGGFISVQSSDEFGARLTGTSFDLLVLSLHSGFTQLFFAPGDPIALSSQVVLDNVELHGAFEGSGRIDLRMSGGSAQVPLGPVHNEVGYQEELLFPTPFSFVGRVWGYDSRGAVAYYVDLVGSGSAEFILLAVAPNPPHWDQDGYVLRETRYSFERAAPVPEPGTLLLLAAGAVASMRRAARMRISRC